jgi:hypothetical protein
MIPEFPKFKKLELSDKIELEKLISKFPPYSDFNFTSLWIWDVHNLSMVSKLNDNLVTLFSDYISGEKFFSFIGINKISETALELLSFSKEHYNVNFLKLIPEELISSMPNESIKIEPNRDSYDYVFSISKLADMENWAQNTSGKRVRKFIKSNPDFSIEDMSIDKIPKDEYRTIFKKWSENKKVSDHFELNEYKAFERLLEIDDKRIRFISLFLDKKLVGFTAYEILSDNFAISHFAKVDYSHSSLVFDVLNWQEAKFLNKKGVKYFNWEQDLGISGLRYAKEKYKPSFFLKKFIISGKQP